MAKKSGKYSIKDLESLSGIRAHTIRIWEQRYKLLTPSRSSTNIRTYDNSQLRKLLNISTLLANGFKISKIAMMKQEEMNKHLLNLHSVSDPSAHNEKIFRLIVAMAELNEVLFEKVFASSVLQLGLEKTFVQVIYPFLNRTGILWSVDEIHPAQEHFISNLIRQKIIAATDAQPISDRMTPEFILFLPAGELHEIGLLLSNYLLRQVGRRTIYLGQNVPLENVAQVYDAIKPPRLLCFITSSRTKEEIEAYLNELATRFNSAEIYVAGRTDVLNVRFPKKIKHLRSVDEFESLL